MTTSNIQRRKFTGVVLACKMQKTIVVVVDRLVWNQKYKKQYQQKTKFMVDDAKGQAQVGQTVVIEECRPLSKLKRWRLVSIVK
ncbi:MAG: 30S ribosomal protein S17 [Candidatus Komeilibacteria bacterium]|nr:30S ribosomal protein S17 [Candidatus Komeilibacteria bacterium]